MVESYATYDNCERSVILNSPEYAVREMKQDPGDTYLFTLHEIFYEEQILKQTRSSPNWQGGVATMATCKQQMRTWRDADSWVGCWNVMLCPSHCADNTVFFIGKVHRTFPSNYDYGVWCKRYSWFGEKRASADPRGDLYTPKKKLTGEDRYNQSNFLEPPNHTRSLERYPDGTPKWWKDIRYKLNGKRPVVFVFKPAFLFSQPSLWSSISPGRAVRTMSSVVAAHSLGEGR